MCDFTFQRAKGANFKCRLRRLKCPALKPDGTLCGRATIIGIEYCGEHLRSVMGLQIKPSAVPGAGMGLFAVRRNPSDPPVVFHTNMVVCPYNGEALNAAQLNARYGKFTAPYALRILRTGKYIDSACFRGVGALANHSGSPNCALQIRQGFNGENLPVVVALRNITDGEELLVDYGREYGLDEHRHQTVCTRPAEQFVRHRFRYF